MFNQNLTRTNYCSGGNTFAMLFNDRNKTGREAFLGTPS